MFCYLKVGTTNHKFAKFAENIARLFAIKINGENMMWITGLRLTNMQSLVTPGTARHPSIPCGHGMEG